MHNFSRHNFYLKIGTLFHLIFDAFCCLIDYKNICVVLITRICRGILFHFQIGIFQVPYIWPQVTCTIYGLRYLSAGWTGWFVIFNFILQYDFLVVTLVSMDFWYLGPSKVLLFYNDPLSDCALLKAIAEKENGIPCKHKIFRKSLSYRKTSSHMKLWIFYCHLNKIFSLTFFICHK